MALSAMVESKGINHSVRGATEARHQWTLVVPQLGRQPIGLAARRAPGIFRFPDPVVPGFPGFPLGVCLRRRARRNWGTHGVGLVGLFGRMGPLVGA